MNLSEIVSSCNIRSKEVDEVTEFLRQVQPLFAAEHPRKVIDLCSGNGLLGMYIAGVLGMDVLAIDERESTKYQRLSAAMHLRYDLARYSFMQRSVWDDALPEIIGENVLIFSIHACGQLTDRVIELGVALRAPLAVMSCCATRDEPYFHPRNMPRRDCAVRVYHDRVRLNYLLEQGFHVEYSHVDRRITRCNGILIAYPV